MNKSDIIINPELHIPEHELIITTSRAGGPGGQHVNKSDTRVTIRWHIAQSHALPEELKQRLLEKLSSELSGEGYLMVSNGSTRSQLQNRQLAYKQLAHKISKALHVPKKRMKTKISAAAKEKRLHAKKAHSEIKRMRRIKE